MACRARRSSASPSLRLVTVVVAMAALLACSSMPAASGPASASSSPREGRPSEKIGAVSASASPDASETAVTDRSFSEDEFWSRVSAGEHQQRYPALDDLVQASDLIVVGTVESLEPGRDRKIVETGEVEYNATAKVAISDVLKGTPKSTAASAGVVNVEFLLGFQPGLLTPFAKSLPRDRVLLFLRNKGEEARSLGATPDAPGAGTHYYFVRGLQGVIRDRNGSGSVLPDESGDWLNDLDGRPFTEVVEEVRAVIGRE